MYGINSISIKSKDGFQYIFDKIESAQSIIFSDFPYYAETFYFLPPRSYLNPVSIEYSSSVKLTDYRLSKIIDLKTNKFCRISI